jgi:ribosomal protein S18 acetylase RimI-like enzyme
MIVIRPCRVAECPAVLALWQRAGAIPSPTDTLVELEQLVTYQDDGLLVAVENGVIVGSVIGGWDGWRGNIYRLAVAPEARRHGLARRLVDDAVRVLNARGAHRISALVERHEAHAVGFWDSLIDRGWRRDERMLRYIKNVDA